MRELIQDVDFRVTLLRHIYELNHDLLDAGLKQRIETSLSGSVSSEVVQTTFDNVILQLDGQSERGVLCIFDEHNEIFRAKQQNDPFLRQMCMFKGIFSGVCLFVCLFVFRSYCL